MVETGNFLVFDICMFWCIGIAPNANKRNIEAKMINTVKKYS